jgi:Uma2 family endonuclease
MTAEEYFALEETSLERNEFYNGEIFALSGATRKHNLVVANLVVHLKAILKDRPYEVYPSDMRVSINEYNHYTYPDVTVVCGQRIFGDAKETTLINPVAIIEVLSDSTEGSDRGKKFKPTETSLLSKSIFLYPQIINK